jgi:hypothetical protein
MARHVLALSVCFAVTSLLSVVFGNLGFEGGIGWPWGFGWIGFIPFLSRSEFRFVPFLADVLVVSTTYAVAVLVTARIRHASPSVAPGVAGVFVLFIFLKPAVHGVSAPPEVYPFAPGASQSKGIGAWNLVPSGTSSALFGVAAADTDEVWAVGEGGTVLRWDGVGWNAIESPVLSGTHLWDVWASRDGEVWAVGQEPSTDNLWGTHGIVLHYDGKQWDKEPVHTSKRLEGVWGSSIADVWAVGVDETLHWDGELWARTPRPGLKVTGSSKNNVWCLTDRGVVSQWNGASWEQVRSTMTDARHIWSGWVGDVWVAGGPNGIHHFDGSTWTTTEVSYYSVAAIWGSAPTDVWAAGGELISCTNCGGLLHWDGLEWHRWNTQLESVIVLDLGGTAPDDVWAVGIDGKILHFGAQ